MTAARVAKGVHRGVSAGRKAHSAHQHHQNHKNRRHRRELEERDIQEAIYDELD